MIKMSALAAIAIALAAVGVTPASATLIKYTFEGEVTNIISDDTGQVGTAGITAGTTFSGQFQYDTSAVLTTLVGTLIAVYPGISNDVTFNTGGAGVVVQSSSSRVVIANQHPSLNDRAVFAGDGLTSANFTYDDSYAFSVDLQDTTQMVFDSLDLPTTALLLSDFDLISFNIRGLTIAGGEDNFTGTITALTADIPAVPVPAALPLFLSGLLGLGVMARCRKQKAA
ncbi:MAG: VPLPA-CTERM sorting domain-containing protein [Rhodospirillaceae bacterium]|nr:VPLPA-CTERM sorting domain-containing protein [Rhodospirillaceae bacterium]MBT6912633.1 VPLPA-CTERM sorting domain-containing protein [Rhodospirillaceae bacterium]MBT7287749.1 VPLPA-CTERM sorting domain-containing protein [Rhodospirillaceae bacterium]